MKWLRQARELRSSPEAATRFCTVSFTNMTGYVGIAERMPLDKLPVFMNRYFEAHGTAIQARDGIIDKYIGDVVVALWSQGDGAQLACEAALDQSAEMVEFHAWAAQNGYPSPSFRIGINSGSMRVGEVGTDYLRHFTVMGNEVNRASRLEGRNKAYGTRILIAGATRERLSHDLVVRPVDRVRVKGEEGVLEIFELLCRAGDLTQQKMEFLEVYRRAFDQYGQEQFAEALRSVEQAQLLAPGDGPCAILNARCRDRLQERT